MTRAWRDIYLLLALYVVFQAAVAWQAIPHLLTAEAPAVNHADTVAAVKQSLTSVDDGRASHHGTYIKRPTPTPVKEPTR